MQAFYSRQYATFFDTQHITNVGSRFTAAIQNPDVVNVDQLREMLGGVGYKAAYGLLYDGSIVWQRVREQHNGAWKAHSDILRVD